VLIVDGGNTSDTAFYWVPFWGWVEGAGALESSYADSVVDCEGVGDPMLEPEPEGT